MPLFDEPEETAGLRINPADAQGHLLLVWAVQYVAHSPTRFTQPGKQSDVIIVDVVDLDQNGEDGQPGLLARRTWWRQGKLIQALRPKVGAATPMLVQMSKGTGSQGFAAPFILVSMTQDRQAVARATRWLENHPDFKPSDTMVLGVEVQQSSVDPSPASNDTLLGRANQLPPPPTQDERFPF